MKIRFGPAGIPLSCKGRTLKDGIEDIHALQLDAMEIQLLRPQREIPEDLALIRELGEELDVKLSIHSPYYMDLLGDPTYRDRSMENLMWAGEMAQTLGADVLSITIGMYHERTPDEALELAVKEVRSLRDRFRKLGYDTQIGIETSGRQKVFGSLDEVLTIIKRVQRTIPVLNIPNIHSREGGMLREIDDFEELFNRVRAVTRSDSFYTHFSGVEHADGDKIMATPIKKGDLRFDPMAEMMLDHEDWEFRVISESPLLEHDAVYMKLILDRILQRKIQKEERLKVKPCP
ncbi:MAG: TIM barrel protein [Candidatus Thermoplasmatota archaeon]|nr:TIM barrel protein [Candidatus Thermoplasmatota archaeon]